MESRTISLRFWLYLFFSSLLCLTGCGVGEIGGGIPSAGDKYECTTPVLKCPQQNQQLKVIVNRPPQIQNCYSVRKNLQVGSLIYCDKSWVIKDIGYDKLKGSDLIVSRFSFDNNDKSPVFLDVQPLDEVDGVYVAYDSRAQKKPDWLKRDYTQVTGTSGPLYIKIFQQDKLVDLEVWRRNQTPKKNERFTVPGNFAGYPSGWPPGFNLGDAAMYAVMVKPLQIDNCNNVNPTQDLVEEHFNSPSCPSYISNIKDAEKAALNACEQSLDTSYRLICGKPNCITEGACPDPNAVNRSIGLTMQPLSFMRSSEIEFNPTKYKSIANIEVLGNKYTKNVTGTLHFEYLLNDLSQLREMQVNSMLLKVDPLDTKAGKFTDIVIDLLAPVKAYCKDKNPPWATPCDWYQIRKGEFLASEAAMNEGKHLLFATYNLNPVDIKIDHSTRTFQIIGGPLTTTVKIDGKDTVLDVDIDLFGHFLNFAPQAVGTESMRVVECAEDKNQDPVLLDAGASFEVYNDPIPNSAYKWYEDYGLVTEKFWGQGQKITIAPYQLGFGVHDITLAIRDSHGVTDTDTFEVEVRDSTPPDLRVPQDVFIVPERPGSVKVDIGEAGASDTCSSNVMITNDAPEGLLFPPGVVTDVTWRADDGRGNVTEKVQKVSVFSTGDKMPEGPKLEPTGSAAVCDQYAKSAVSQNKMNLERACGFTGPRWNSDYNLHYQWCTNVSKQLADFETDQREVALTNNCAGAQPQGGGTWSGPEARCDQYAKSAVYQNQENLSRGCGYSGPRWNSDYNLHYKWCVNVSEQLAELERSEREKGIKGCSGTRSPGHKNEGIPLGPDVRCDEYARTAISQNQQNLERGCGFRGPAWSDNYSQHYDWCQRVPKEQADAGTKQREEALGNKCFNIEQQIE